MLGTGGDFGLGDTAWLKWFWTWSSEELNCEFPMLGEAKDFALGFLTGAFFFKETAFGVFDFVFPFFKGISSISERAFISSASSSSLNKERKLGVAPVNASRIAALLKEMLFRKTSWVSAATIR
jgi:hypothetical protein